MTGLTSQSDALAAARDGVVLVDRPDLATIALGGADALRYLHAVCTQDTAGLRPGDSLVLTKALGTGVVTTALKHGRGDATEHAAAIDSMLTLNAAAAYTNARTKGNICNISFDTAADCSTFFPDVSTAAAILPMSTSSAAAAWGSEYLAAK